MNIRTILVGVAILAGVGYVFYDYNSPESKNARELKEIEQLEPDTKPPDCFPKGVNAKLFAEVIQRDRRKPAEVENDQTRRSAIEHDCIRGAGAGYEPTQIRRLVKALGPAGIPVYTEVLEKCPIVKDEYPTLACLALDALQAEGSKDSTAAIEKELSNHDKARKNVYLGALYRLMNTPGWKNNTQLAEFISAQGDEWKAKELIIEHIRNNKDPSAKPALEKAYATETDQQEKGMIKGALLELDNPGKCVMMDEGRAENGVCRYTCHDQGRWFSVPKPAEGCPLVRDLPPEAQQGTPQVNAATPAPAPNATPAAAKK
ncbi:MAG TPA: hypothetical protein VLW85_26445 [Myxococcales bacterium]|nr:hypothetical protein [Myxococcales bacterium]